MQDSGFLGCGEILVAPFNADGTFSNKWYNLGESDKFELKSNTETKTRLSKKCATYNQPASSLVIGQPTDLSIGMTTMNADNFALLFLSKVEDGAQVAGSFDETFDVAKGRITRLSVANVLTLAVTTTDDVTTYVEGTDYKLVNASLGLVEILETGGIADGDIKFAGTTGATTVNLMKGNSQVGKPVRVMLVGKNQDNDNSVEVVVFEVKLAPQNGVDFLASDFVSGELSGQPIIDQGEGTAFIVKENQIDGS